MKLTPTVTTPTQVQRWLHTLAYNKADTMRTIVGVTKHKTAHCLEAAMSAAAILEHRGYPPLILDLESTDGIDHTLFLYRLGGKYGTIGKSRDIGLDGRKPLFSSLEALVKSYLIPYVDAKANITGYGVLDLRALQRGTWRTSSRNVWYVEQALRDLPHRRLRLSPRQLQLWRNKYIAFKAKYPHRQPNYFPGASSWT